MKNYTITVNGIAYDVTVEENTGRVNRSAAPAVQMPAAAPAPVVTPQAAPVPAPAQEAAVPKAAAPSGAPGGIKVNAPMPGKILALKANIGQTVKRGEVILILEAMKMENEIVAPEEGTVATIDVSVGEMVEAGVPLATLK